MIQEYGTVRLLYQIGPDFRGFSPGAVWDDEKLGVSHHLTAWGRNAVVTDIDWIRNSIMGGERGAGKSAMVYSGVVMRGSHHEG